MGAELAHEITANFLGMPDDLAEGDILDCLQEVVNMMSGNFVGQGVSRARSPAAIPQSRELHGAGNRPGLRNRDAVLPRTPAQGSVQSARMKTIGVMVVDDSAVVRRALTRLIDAPRRT
jgi:hypothetical protein